MNRCCRLILVILPVIALVLASFLFGSQSSVVADKACVARHTLSQIERGVQPAVTVK